jgi:hypothetical protein
MLPYTVQTSAGESAEANANLSRALASMTGTRTELEMGGDAVGLT